MPGERLGDGQGRSQRGEGRAQQQRDDGDIRLGRPAIAASVSNWFIYLYTKLMELSNSEIHETLIRFSLGVMMATS